MNEYEKQAQDFLKKAKTKLEIKFKKFDSMPWDDDKQKRNIFAVTLSNKRSEYTFDFGASTSDSCAILPKIEVFTHFEVYAGFKTSTGFYFGEKLKLDRSELINGNIGENKITQIEENLAKAVDSHNKKAKQLRNGFQELSKLPPMRRVIADAIKRELEKAQTETTISNTQADEIKIPTAYDILSCLSPSHCEDFEDFCANFGYDEDSRKAYSTWEAVQEQDEELKSLFTPEQLEMLSEIQ